MTDKEAMKLALDALEYANTGNRRPEVIGPAITALRQAIEQPEQEFSPDWDAMAVMVEEQQRMAKRIEELEQAAKQEPLGYWNAVEGWVDLPQDKQQPTAWVYPEGLEALQQGQPWTAYGSDGRGQPHNDVERIPLYASPQPANATERDYMEADAVEALTEDGWIWDGDQWQRPPDAPNWSVFNTGAEVASGLSFAEALEFMTPERLSRGWSAVCVVNKDNLPAAPTPKEPT